MTAHEGARSGLGDVLAGSDAVSERYTPAASPGATGFMAARTGRSHGGFFVPHLRAGMALLDCGCGPGTITADLARAVAPGRVSGVDADPGAVDEARRNAQANGVDVDFRAASAYELPFDDARFDAVFTHALLEHLSDPVAALAEMSRVARPGAALGACSPDWGGFILTPDGHVGTAVARYRELMTANGGHPLAGRRLVAWVQAAGFHVERVDARYERYDDPAVIAGYLAAQLEAAGDAASAQALRLWATDGTAMFAQAWVSVVARRG